MSWNPIEHPVDYILLASKKSPGIADVAGAGSPRKWDERGGYGLSGATVFYTGDKIANFSVKLRLYSVQDWNDWHGWKYLVKKAPLGVRPKALDIWHPFLEELEIKSVVVEDALQPVMTREDGEWTIEVKFKQFRQPKPQYSKPEGSKATPIDPVDQTIAALTAQVQELAR